MIKLTNVTKIYKTGVRALNDVNLTIEPGEFVYVIGTTGAGKSTFIKLLLKELNPTEGMITVGNIKLSKLKSRGVAKYRRKLGVVFQDFRLLQDRDVYSNIAFAQHVIGASPREIKKNVARVLSLVGLSEKYRSNPNELSGGEQQRVALARAMVKKPGVFLMDEPLSNLDAKLRAQMRVEIAKLHKQLNATIIYVTHDQVEAMTLGTRIVVMNRGMIQQVAPPAELYRNPVNIFVAGFIGSPTMNFLDVDVLEEDGTVWLLGQGWRLPLEGYQARKLKEKGFAGKRVTLGIRPEDLHQEECSGKNGSSGLNGNGSGWIGVYISVREMLGSEVLLHGNTGDTGRLSARMPASCRVKPGEFLRLYVDMSQIKLFDIQTEENILFD